MEADPLVSNGLGSPSCRGGAAGAALSARARANCETSGFVAAAAPTGDFGLDVHIDTGLLGLSSGGLLASVQDLCVAPLWMALVWAVHALVVMLEWCFEIDLLDSPSVQLGVARGLRATQAAFTMPWLATAFAVGAVVLAYDGLVRRQIGESLARAALALAMTAAARKGTHPAKIWTSSTARKPRMQPGSIKGTKRSGRGLSSAPPGLRRHRAETRMASQGRRASSTITSG